MVCPVLHSHNQNMSRCMTNHNSVPFTPGWNNTTNLAHRRSQSIQADTNIWLDSHHQYRYHHLNMHYYRNCWYLKIKHRIIPNKYCAWRNCWFSQKQVREAITFCSIFKRMVLFIIADRTNDKNPQSVQLDLIVTQYLRQVCENLHYAGSNPQTWLHPGPWCHSASCILVF